ncbi:MAG TPA: hypothetical protein VGK25_08525 [Ignavibacteria bacterium]|jgi:hypothetical protein
MLKKHLAVMLLFVMAAGVFSQSIPSGTGRYEALANSPFILDAATNIGNNPAWTNYYKDYSFGDVGRNVISNFELSDPYAGVTFGVGKKLGLGVIVNKRSDLWDNFGGNAVSVSSPVVPIMPLIGYSLNKNFHIGLAPYVTMWKHNKEYSDTVSVDTNLSSSSLGANLGVMYNMKKGWIEGVVRFRMNKYKNEQIPPSGTTTTLENDGGIELAVNLRGWFNTKSKWAVVPVLGFSTYSFTPKTISTITVLGPEYSWMSINGGIGLNIPITDDIQIAGGLLAEYNTFKASFSDTTGSYEFKGTDFVAPRFNLAGETRIADWLTARMGFNRAIIMRSNETNNPGFSLNEDLTLGSSPDQTVSLGAGFHFGRFSIDATVSEEWLKRGINFVSGTQTDLFGVISASYNFAK